MVVDSSLRIAGEKGTSEDVTNATDRSLLLHLRSLADLIITDAATAAAERYRPSRFCNIEVWSRSGDFRGLQESKPKELSYGLSLQVVSDAEARIASLRKSYKRILLETGPTLTKALSETRQVDFACISVTGAARSNEANSSLARFRQQLRLDYLSTADTDWFAETLFARLQR